MGTSGTALYEDDAAHDVRRQYVELLARGSHTEATQAIIASWAGAIDDVDEGPVFWLALADTQWKYGCLSEDVKVAALEVIDSGRDLRRWESSPLLTRRRTVLQNLKKKDDNIRLAPPDKGGGPLYDIGIYCINAARYCFAEDPVEVWATATRSNDRRFREVDETVAATLRFKDERLATFTCSFGAADRSVYSITGTKGSVTLDPAYEYAAGLAYRMTVGGRERKKKFRKSDQFAPELLYFSDCILKDREPEPSGEEGLLDVQIIEAMLQSIATGRPVRLETRQREQRPTLRQEIRSPAVPSEPKLVDVKPASQ